MAFDGMMEPENQVALVLQKARDLLVKKGWIQGGMQSEYGFCSIGAIMAAARVEGRSLDNSNHSYWQAKRALGETISTAIIPIPSWNDDPKRTKAEVLAAFDATIDRLAQGSQVKARA